MAVTVPKKAWEQFFRVQTESSFGAGGNSSEWWHGGNGGATGWMDMAVVPGAVRFTPNEVQIFPRYAAGKRAVNQQAPIAGAYEVSGSLEMPVYPELIDRFIYACLGSVSRTETAGSMVLAAATFNTGTFTPGTQSNGSEQFKIVLTSPATFDSGAIALVQNSVTLETLSLGTNATTGSWGGNYYTRGGYTGGAGTSSISIIVSGAASGGTISASGVDKVTNVFTLGTSVVTLKIEEAGQPKSASNSMYYTGVVIPNLSFIFDRTALDGMLMCTATAASKFPSASTAGTFANDAKNYYYPTAGWTCAITKGGSAFEKLQGATININGNSQLFPVASGGQDASGAFAGEAEVTGTLTVLPEDATEWNAFTGQTVGDYELTFTLPQYIVDSTGWSIKFELTQLYIETYTENVNNELFGAELAFRTTDHSSDGPVKVTTVSRMPV